MTKPGEDPSNFLEWGREESRYTNKRTGEVTKTQRKFLRADRFGKMIVLLLTLVIAIAIAAGQGPLLRTLANLFVR